MPFVYWSGSSRKKMVWSKTHFEARKIAHKKGITGGDFFFGAKSRSSHYSNCECRGEFSPALIGNIILLISTGGNLHHRNCDSVCWEVYWCVKAWRRRVFSWTTGTWRTRGAEQGSDFARGVKRRSWRTAVRFKEDLDAFMKPIHDHNAWHRQLKATYPGLVKFPVKRIRGKGERADWYYNLKKTEFGDKGVYKWPNIYDQFPLLYSSSNSLQSKL